MRIAIGGPDGPGKSTICNSLSRLLENSVVIYAGKRDFILWTTGFGFRIWMASKRYGRVLSLIAKYFLYYPLEYIENRVRFRAKSTCGSIKIYDRHPIDRVMMRYELKNQFKVGDVKKIRFLFEYPIRYFWAFVYKKFFPLIDKVYVLLPETNLCFERSGGQYKSISDARIRVESYREAIDYLSCHHANYVAIPVSSGMNAQQVCEHIINDSGLSFNAKN